MERLIEIYLTNSDWENEKFIVNYVETKNGVDIIGYAINRHKRYGDLELKQLFELMKLRIETLEQLKDQDVQCVECMKIGTLKLSGPKGSICKCSHCLREFTRLGLSMFKYHTAI